jgi:hypothetical protein
MPDIDKPKATDERRRSAGDPQDQTIRLLEQIASTLTKIQHELIQLRVQAANVNVSLARKR